MKPIILYDKAMAETCIYIGLHKTTAQNNFGVCFSAWQKQTAFKRMETITVCKNGQPKPGYKRHFLLGRWFFRGELVLIILIQKTK